MKVHYNINTYNSSGQVSEEGLFLEFNGSLVLKVTDVDSLGDMSDALYDLQEKIEKIRKEIVDNY